MIPTISLRTFLSPPKRNPLSISSPSHFSPASSPQAGKFVYFAFSTLSVAFVSVSFP